MSPLRDYLLETSRKNKEFDRQAFYIKFLKNVLPSSFSVTKSLDGNKIIIQIK